MHTYEYEYTDTFAGEANYSWVKSGTVTVPDLTAYGYDGSNCYSKAAARRRRGIMRDVKAKLGLSGVRGVTSEYGDTFEFRPYRCATVLFVNYSD